MWLRPVKAWGIQIQNHTILPSYFTKSSIVLIMVGVVLCGGQSTRMGTDKGLLKSYANTWAEAAANKLKALALDIKISINTKQFGNYSNIFPVEILIADNDSLKIKGPLCGILSVHIQHPSQDLLVLACDMLLLETEILEELLAYYRLHPDAEAIVFTNANEPEPLCGIYRAKGLTQIHHLYKKGQLPNYSMKNVLESISTFLIPLSMDKTKLFSNFNTQAERNDL